jgi:hypothetical protein
MPQASIGLSREDQRGGKAAGREVTRFPGAYRTRREAAEYLQARGYPTSFSTLQKLCALGEGPEPAAWWGARPLYTDEGLDAWAAARCRRPAASLPQLAAESAERRAPKPKAE